MVSYLPFSRWLYMPCDKASPKATSARDGFYPEPSALSIHLNFVLNVIVWWSVIVLRAQGITVDRGHEGLPDLVSYLPFSHWLYMPCVKASPEATSARDSFYPELSFPSFSTSSIFTVLNPARTVLS